MRSVRNGNPTKKKGFLFRYPPHIYKNGKYRKFVSRLQTQIVYIYIYIYIYISLDNGLKN
jgi:hypothetical protein